MKKVLKTKVQRLIYFVLFLWLLMGGVALYLTADFTALTHYFLALSGFVSSYIVGELFRPSENTTPIFVKGRTSKREAMIYVVTLLWLVVGVGAMFFTADLSSVAMYFAALIPFVDLYILGDSFKPEEIKELREKFLDSTPDIE